MKLPVEIDHSQEPLKSRLIRWLRKGGDGSGMLGQLRTTGGKEKMAKKLDLVDSKIQFWKPNCQAMLPTEEKNLLEVIHMRKGIPGENKYVIHVNKAERKIIKNLIRKALEHVTLHF